jgi:dihydroneopterin aldolase
MDAIFLRRFFYDNDYKIFERRPMLHVNITSFEDLEKFQNHLNADTRWQQVSEQQKQKLFEKIHEDIAQEILEDVYSDKMVEKKAPKAKSPRKPRVVKKQSEEAE